MGTNYYFFTRNKRLVHKYFGNGQYWDDYKIVDEPRLGYSIHLNKCSCGWRPLFQCHQAFQTFADLEQFYQTHQRSLKIYDEYDREYTWQDYKQLIVEHGNRKPEPMKWVYEEDKIFGKPGRKYLQTVECKPEEAEIWIPFNHQEYARTEREAQERFHCYNDIEWMVSKDLYSHSDTEYPVDWTNGDFA